MTASPGGTKASAGAEAGRVRRPSSGCSARAMGAVSTSAAGPVCRPKRWLSSAGRRWRRPLRGHARGCLGRGLEVVQGSADGLPFEDETFDAAYPCGRTTDIEDFSSGLRRPHGCCGAKLPWSTIGAHPCFVGPHSLFVGAEGVPICTAATVPSRRYDSSAPGVANPTGSVQRVDSVHLPARCLPERIRGRRGSKSSDWKSSVTRDYPHAVATASAAMSIATSPWGDLLQGEEIAHVSTEPAREALLAPLPDELHPRVRDALAAQGIDQLYTHQRETWDAAANGEHNRRHDRHGQREDARVQPAGTRRDRPGAETASSLPLSDQGARAGPVAVALDVPPATPSRRDLRRRHRDRAAVADPQVGQTSS